MPAILVASGRDRDDAAAEAGTDTEHSTMKRSFLVLVVGLGLVGAMLAPGPGAALQDLGNIERRAPEVERDGPGAEGGDDL